jgi:hypothetical protein
VSPQGGAFLQPPLVTLSADPTASIRYTLNGSDPSSLSNLYEGSIAIPANGATVKARAFKDGWSASTVSSATYVIDTTPPTVTAGVTPRANAAGWHNGPVTVTFTCGDNVAIATCPASVTVSSDGTTQVVSASAVDTAGNETPISVALNIDRTPPTVALPSELTSEVSVTELSLEAVVSDSLSGVTSGTCNGIPSQLSSGALECVVTLRKGRNIIIVAASDAAGNTASISGIVSLVPTTAATTLVVSPASAGMTVGESRRFRVKDDQGRLVSADWESSDPLVASFADGVVTAVAQGEATLTATADGLSASTELVVYGPMVEPKCRWLA